MPSETDEQFTTEDVDLASYIFSKTLIAPAIEHNGRRCVFKFPPRVAEAASNYHASESFGFARARRTLCWELHRVREQGGGSDGR